MDELRSAVQSRKAPNPRLSLYFAPCIGLGVVVVCHYLRWEAKVAGEAEPLGLEGGVTDGSPSYFVADPVTGAELGERGSSWNDCP